MSSSEQEAVQLEMRGVPEAFTVEDVPLSLVVIRGEPEESVYAHVLKSVKTFGTVLQDPAFIREDDGTFTVIFGKRRVLAARAAGMEKIKAKVFPKGTPPEVIAAMTLVENGARKPNPAAEAENLEIVLSAYNLTPKEVQEKFGIPVSLIKARLPLLKLIPEFFRQLRDGKLTLSMAQKLCKLPGERQKELFEEEDLTLDKITDAVRDKKLEGLQAAELFELPKLPPEDEVIKLIREAEAKLDRAIAITTNGRKATLEKVVKMLKKIEKPKEVENA